MGRRRLPGRLHLLHALGLPDHVAAAGRAHHHPLGGRRLGSGSGGCAGSCPPRWPRSTLAVLFAHFAGTAAQQRNLAGDVISALADVANWHFIFSHQSYADLFSGPVAGAALLEPGHRGAVLPGLPAGGLRGAGQAGAGTAAGSAGSWSVLMAASLATTLFLGFSHDRIYYGTETRSFELLAGALLAVIIYSRRVTGRLARPGSRRTAVAVAGAVALAVCVVLWARTPQTRRLAVPGRPVGLLGAVGADHPGHHHPLRPGGRPAVDPRAAAGGHALLRRSTSTTGRSSCGSAPCTWAWGNGPASRWRWPSPGWWPCAPTTSSSCPIRRGELPFGLKDRGWAAAGQPGLGHPGGLPAGRAWAALAVTAAAPPPAFDFAAAQRTLEHLGAGSLGPSAGQDRQAGPTAPLPVAKVAAFGDSTALVVGSGINDGRVQHRRGGGGHRRRLGRLRPGHRWATTARRSTRATPGRPVRRATPGPPPTPGWSTRTSPTWPWCSTPPGT